MLSETRTEVTIAATIGRAIRMLPIEHQETIREALSAGAVAAAARCDEIRAAWREGVSVADAQECRAEWDRLFSLMAVLGDGAYARGDETFERAEDDPAVAPKAVTL